jgi:hypothetical protein
MRSRIRIRIEGKRWIRIRIKVMGIRNPSYLLTCLLTVLTILISYHPLVFCEPGP